MEQVFGIRYLHSLCACYQSEKTVSVGREVHYALVVGKTDGDGGECF